MTTVRVMTYNILMGGRRGAPLHEVVRSVAPDVLLVNESPKRPLVWRRQCAELAREWRMSYAGGGRSAGSNMLLTDHGVRVKKVWTETVRHPLFGSRRGLLLAQLRVGGQMFGVVSTHLDLDAGRRADQVARVIEAAHTLRGPVVLGGDLNEAPDGPSWERLRRAGFTDNGNPDWPTFPSDEPTARIDALLVRGAARVVFHGDPGVPDGLLARASDHRPVLAVVDLFDQ